MIIVKNHIEEIMYGRRTSGPWFIILRMLSTIYVLLVRLRHALYSSGILKRNKLDEPVISVGNLTVGGTGKTPAVISIANFLKKKGRSPVVISRGYGRRDESEIMTVSDGNRVLVDARTGGDEPVLIAIKTKDVPVVVGSDRWKAALFAHKSFHVDTVILDDGFQHIRLGRNLDIVLVDGTDPFGNGLLFPAGLLREPLSGLARADVVLITGSDRVSDLEEVKNTIRQCTAAKIFTSCHVPTDLEAAITGERKSLAALQGTKVLAFSGIARPGSFLSTLRSLGADVALERHFPDHYEYSSYDLADILKTADEEGIGMIVTTEKDIMRLRGLNPSGVWALRIELKVNEIDEWEAVLSKRA